MRKALGACGAVALLFAMITIAGAQDKTMTWAGWISDSACAAKGMNAAHKDCALKCVKEKGASWVFVEAESKKVLPIHNQDAVSEDQLGHEVEVTGHVMEDGSLHIDKIMPKA